MKENPLRLVGADLMWTGCNYSLLDHNYLNDSDRADLHIMANIFAMHDTSKKLRFVLQSEDGSLLGYWQPNATIPLGECVLFWLDTEGQYEVAEGRTLSESLAYRALVDGDDDTCSAVIAAFDELDVVILPTSEDEIFAGMDNRRLSVSETPQIFRDRRYQHHRQRSGLD